ncbi:2-dehydropantoate 2-reductase [Myxococcus stipitatus DSM 14675]|uniref:2-dehydropantoate 2-reductase n=1 Tax=Myxococcus stipitatus (strain DSM 14675 / JCM 12634 / Mx s8) TaxID=1278073 RepID=L7UAM7_MYXSD|nr:2-dehydropantoate 2-reductase [Myxococcus stipitatus]AGC44910.1 2-dehydropantoate 2-reductase [Myxococcus stipitatus DSM 14675]
MRFAIVGSGGVGGYYGARLVRAGHDVRFLARGAHLSAMRSRGLTILSVEGDFTVPVRAEEDAARLGPVDVVVLAVKNYDVASVLPQVKALVAASERPALGGTGAVVVTLQNGVDSPSEVAAAVGELTVVGGTTYMSTAIHEPGVIRQVGTLHRIVLGEAFGDTSRVSERVRVLKEELARAGLNVEAVADIRGPLWEKLAFLASMSGFCTAGRSAVGVLREGPFFREMFREAVSEVLRVAAAEGVVTTTRAEDVVRFMEDLPREMRPSMMVDFDAGKTLEVEYLQGTVARRGHALGIPTPVMSTLYSVLIPHARGTRQG